MSEVMIFKHFTSRLPLSQYTTIRVPLGTIRVNINAYLQGTVVRMFATFEVFKPANQRNKNAV